jgi:hypothetical protein
MFIVTQLNETLDNNLRISSDSAVPVLCCCTKYQQISTAVLLHQKSVLATSLRSVDRTNVASSTDRTQPGGLMGGSYRRYLSDKIMSGFPKYRQLIQHIPSTLTVTQTAAVVFGTVRHVRFLLFV